MIVVAAILSVALAVIALLHAYWGLGGAWPMAGADELAQAVVGDGRSRMPPPRACFAVAAILIGVALWPWTLLALPGNRFVLAACALIAAVFFLRGLAGYSPAWRRRHSAAAFAARDVWIYSPLCLLFAAGFAALLVRGI